MKNMVSRGRVTSGAGRASGIVFSEELRRESLSRLLGFDVFPGTLNLVIETPIAFRRAEMIRWDGWRNTIWYCPATLNGVDVYIHDWKTRPRTRLEIVAGVKLRDALTLADGDVVEVAIPSEYVEVVGNKRRSVREWFRWAW